jgi:thioredoxin reductase (NADPH)
MVFFTTPELLEIGDLPFVTPYEKPTRQEALRYYRRVADAFELNVEFDVEVVQVVPDDLGPQGRLLAVETRSTRGIRVVRHARAVVIATGCYDYPNLLCVPGEDLPHVSHYYSEPHEYYRKSVVVVGGKNSAADAALDLHRSGVDVTLVYRGAEPSHSIKYWVRPDLLNRIAEGSIHARFNTRVVEIRPTTIVVASDDRTDELPADAVFLLTGYHSDTEFLSRCSIRWHDETLEPEHDPVTLETNVRNVFLAGSVVSGRNSGKIFIENGRFHGDVVVKVIAERLSAV